VDCLGAGGVGFGEADGFTAAGLVFVGESPAAAEALKSAATAMFYSRCRN
jgi:hypothetical protein